MPMRIERLNSITTRVREGERSESFVRENRENEIAREQEFNTSSRASGVYLRLSISRVSTTTN